MEIPDGTAKEILQTLKEVQTRQNDHILLCNCRHKDIDDFISIERKIIHGDGLENPGVVARIRSVELGGNPEVLL